MTSRKLKANIKSVTPLAHGFLKLNRYEFETDKHDGGAQVIVREVMERGHAVAVLGYDPKRDEIVLVNEFRPGCLVAGDTAYTDNLVAGGMAENESPQQAAVREMEEETGLTLGDPIVIHAGAYVSSGGTSEKVAIVVGRVDTSQAGGIHGNVEESEDILTVVVPAQEFIDRVQRGQSADLKTLFAGYWLAQNRRKLRIGAGWDGA
jgi:ADP-ribose pyrophosphatase